MKGSSEERVLVSSRLKATTVAYHTHVCRSTVNSKLRPMQKRHALQRGLHPCPKCAEEDAGLAVMPKVKT